MCYCENRSRPNNFQSTIYGEPSEIVTLDSCLLVIMKKRYRKYQLQTSEKKERKKVLPQLKFYLYVVSKTSKSNDDLYFAKLNI